MLLSTGSQLMLVKMAVEYIPDAEDGETLDNIYILFQFINIQHCYYDHVLLYTTRVFA